MTKKSTRGFTLVELMVVVAIIAILATISTPNLFGFVKRTKARDGANAVASYLQNARDQAMSRGEVVLLRVVSTNGDLEISTYRAPLVDTTQEFIDAATTVNRDRFASSCSEITDPSVPNPFTINNRVAILNPQSAINDIEVAEPLDPNVRVVGFTDPGDGEVKDTSSGSTTLDLCFAPDGRIYTADGAEMVSTDGGCTASMVFVITSDPDIGVAPSGPNENLGQASLNNWVCPPAGGSPDQRRQLSTTLDVAREANFIYTVSMTFNGRVKVD
jgi:prepilin-type N-terminal cleavage/methylation domain-containing protein